MAKDYKKAEGYLKLYLSGELDRQLEERKLRLKHPPKRSSKSDLREEQPDPKPDVQGRSDKLEQDVLRYVDDGTYVFLKNYINIIKTHLKSLRKNDCVTYAILVRFYRHGETWTKIASNLHLSVSSCKRRRKRALEELNREL